MNVKLLRKVKEHILEEPKRLDMDTLGIKRMTGPEKLVHYNAWLEAHPWWRRGLATWAALFILVLAELLRYGLQQLR